jgi:Xaa-Pro dipeptidase
MALSVPAVQRALAADDLDGWLLYDFHGLNPIARRLAGVDGRHVTRRWFYLIPRDDEPVRLVHAIESAVLDDVPGVIRTYAGRRDLERNLAALLTGLRRVAMEYSPAGAIPYVSRVDAGTIELVRAAGVDVVSSGDLVGRFEAAWDEAAISAHRGASDMLYRIKDRTLAWIGERLRSGAPCRELEVQAQMKAWFAEEGLVTDAGPVVAFGEHSGDPHYEPTGTTSRLLGPDEIVLLDLWGKFDRPDAVYADITWTAVSGTPTEEMSKVFTAVAAARDAAIDLVASRIEAGQPVYGWEVDRAARNVIGAAGYGDRFVHRTGHSLGVDVHGNGVHMDDYETHDDRRLLSGTGFTVEPGIYLPAFGIRSEVNVVVGNRDVSVTGARQRVLERV